jgi:hypothetical protein
MKYPVSNKLKAAIEILFDSPAAGLGFLGALEEMSPKNGYQDSLSPNMSPTERARLLRKKLEGYVELCAAQIEELGPDEVLRLRTESAATLIALRELWLHFPEAFEQPTR